MRRTCLRAAVYNEACCAAQRICFFIKQIKVLNGLICEHSGLFARPFRSQNCGKSGLTLGAVFPSCFAKGRTVAFLIQQIVDNLVGKPQIMGIGMQRMMRIFGRFAQNRARFAGKGDQSARFKLL